MAVELITGDDIAIPVTLKNDGTAIALNTGWTIRAILRQGTTKIAPSTYWTCASSDTGIDPAGTAVAADYPNGIILVKIAAADTSALSTKRELQLEVQVDTGTYKTTFLSDITDQITLIKGLIA